MTDRGMRTEQAKVKPVQTGNFYCSGCGRKFRYTHDNEAVCLTKGCPHGR